MNITTTQLVEVDVDLSIQEIYDQMDDSDIEEIIDLLQINGHLNIGQEQYEKTHTEMEWEDMLYTLMKRNVLLLITDEEYSQIRNIYNRLK